MRVFEMWVPARSAVGGASLPASGGAEVPSERTRIADADTFGPACPTDLVPRGRPARSRSARPPAARPPAPANHDARPAAGALGGGAGRPHPGGGDHRLDMDPPARRPAPAARAHRGRQRRARRPVRLPLQPGGGLRRAGRRRQRAPAVRAQPGRRGRHGQARRRLPRGDRPGHRRLRDRPEPGGGSGLPRERRPAPGDRRLRSRRTQPASPRSLPPPASRCWACTSTSPRAGA